MDTLLSKAEQGYTDPQYVVGRACLTDDPPDLAKAEYWLGVSAGKGHPLAKAVLAYGHANGTLGTPPCDESQETKETQDTSTVAALSAELLRECIEWLSEACWCAGWYDGIEFDLWAAIPGPPFQYGGRLIAAFELDVLR